MRSEKMLKRKDCLIFLHPNPYVYRKLTCETAQIEREGIL